MWHYVLTPKKQIFKLFVSKSRAPNLFCQRTEFSLHHKHSISLIEIFVTFVSSTDFLLIKSKRKFSIDSWVRNKWISSYFIQSLYQMPVQSQNGENFARTFSQCAWNGGCDSRKLRHLCGHKCETVTSASSL